MEKIIKNEYKEKIETPKIFDPVFDEGKKEEKKAPEKKQGKGGKEEVVV